MISIVAAANLCCYCTKTKNPNIITYTHNTCNNKVVRNWKKQHLIIGDSGGTVKTPPRWRRRWWWWCNDNPPPTSAASEGGCGLHAATTTVLLLLIFWGTGVNASTIEQSMDTFSNVPQTLSGEDRKKARIQHPKSRDAERCTSKCVTACVRGGSGSPGEGPLNTMRPLVVFKEGFRSRQYCLVECSEICNIIKGGDDGP